MRCASEREKRDAWERLIEKPKAPPSPLTPAERDALTLNCQAMASPDPIGALDAVKATRGAIAKAKTGSAR